MCSTPQLCSFSKQVSNISAWICLRNINKQEAVANSISSQCNSWGLFWHQLRLLTSSNSQNFQISRSGNRKWKLEKLLLLNDPTWPSTLQWPKINRFFLLNPLWIFPFCCYWCVINSSVVQAFKLETPLKFHLCLLSTSKNFLEVFNACKYSLRTQKIKIL